MCGFLTFETIRLLVHAESTYTLSTLLHLAQDVEYFDGFARRSRMKAEYEILRCEQSSDACGKQTTAGQPEMRHLPAGA